MPDFSSFHDVQFPLAVSFGATGGPERRNEIVSLTSGREKRNARFAHSRRRYDAGSGVRSLDDLYEVLAFFEARRGSLHAFRFRDPFDMKSGPPGAATSGLDQPLGAGDGARLRFPLVKTYGEGADAYARPIRLPASDSLAVAVDWAPVSAGAYHFDGQTGEVVLATPPANGLAVTAGFVFDVPVRFDADGIQASLTAFKAGQVPSIPLIEVML